MGKEEEKTDSPSWPCFSQAHLSSDQKWTLLHTSAKAVPLPGPLYIHSTEVVPLKLTALSGKTSGLSQASPIALLSPKSWPLVTHSPRVSCAHVTSLWGPTVPFSRHSYVIHPHSCIPQPPPRSRTSSPLIPGTTTPVPQLPNFHPTLQSILQQQPQGM